MVTRTYKAHHRAEASVPMTSVAVEAVRAQDMPPTALRQSAAFPPCYQQQQHGHNHPHHQRCDSNRIKQPRPRCSEVVSGTVAGCATVCCCFPCAMVEVVVLATVRAPAALCRRAVRARRHRCSASAGQASDIYELLVDDSTLAEPGDAAMVWPAVKPTEEMGELEKEVWARFYGVRFWRSPSQLGDEIR